jgi:sucrose-6-phosphate hydrolase SacC (GH32 family)
MTCLRELEFIDGQLYQRPLRELSALRGEAHGWQGTPCRWHRWKSFYKPLGTIC